MYDDFLAKKFRSAAAVGFAAGDLHPRLFPHQIDLVRWATRKGRAAIFADTGLGKTAMQLEWARLVVAHSGRPVLIVAPLAVTAQTAREGRTMGIDVHVSRDGKMRDGINAINYDRLHLIEDASAFGGVVLDESSILKSYDGAMRAMIIEQFIATPFRLACTATPAPNDWTELGNHAEFMGVCSRTEMLATYFCHDGGETSVWRLKGHAQSDFWRWVASWGAVVRMPSDLGHDDAGYALPPMTWTDHRVDVDTQMAHDAGLLFLGSVVALDEQRAVRRSTLVARVAAVAEIVSREPGEPWLIWCELNDESDALAASIPGSVVVQGADTPEEKAERMVGFADGKYRVLISKPKICGFGMNFQRCARMAFVGPSHSYEMTYQAVRRCWRFGQSRPVHVHVVASTADGAIVANYRRKEADAKTMQASMVVAMSEVVRAEVSGTARVTDGYAPDVSMVVPEWLFGGAR